MKDRENVIRAKEDNNVLHKKELTRYQKKIKELENEIINLHEEVREKAKEASLYSIMLKKVQRGEAINHPQRDKVMPLRLDPLSPDTSTRMALNGSQTAKYDKNALKNISG